MNTKKSLFFVASIWMSVTFQAQLKPSASEISTLPTWMQKMYDQNPNVFEVDSLYKQYYSTHSFTKSYHTQYYKRWRRNALNYINEQGFIQYPTPLEFETKMNNYTQKQTPARLSAWSSVGPFFVSGPEGTQGSTQTNVYCLDQSKSNSAILYCGTEPGEVYKSTDGGATWNCVSMGGYFGSGGSQIWGIGVSAVAIHPTNPDVVFVGGDGGIFRSTDGGLNWSNVLVQNSFGVNELLVHPTNGQLVFAATEKGLYRSIDGGITWTQQYSQRAYDIKCNTANANEMYLVKNNPSLIICEFYRSTDSGATWTLQSNGWYSSTSAGRSDGGARIAVTPADPNRVYAYLIGEAKTNDYGYIGIFRSNDGGQSWTLPNGPTGGPYTTSHPNLAYGEPNWTYHQGFYNCALMASDTDADDILIGGLNMWRSNDGGATFTSVAGYVGGPLDIHVDMQDFRAINGTYWATTDGGIYKSTDFYNTQPDFTMTGLRGSDYWGFGSGWNEDVLVGGLYHNGNLAYHENYGFGNYIGLGGGEDATGYVNPGNNKRTYYSDLGGVVLPQSFTDPLSYFSVGKFPNQSYYAAESSEMEFHPNCYNIAFIGKENKLWKTVDGGASYTLLKEFGTTIANEVKYIEISSSNTNVMYVSQQPNSGNTGTLWKSTDGGITWVAQTIPSGNSRRMVLSINPSNENELWLGYPSGANGSKIFKTTNGGGSWTNLTTATLNDESVQSIVHIAGTNGGVYYATEFAVYYRNASMPDWVIDNSGLPTYCNTNIARPFYRDGKIRIATYGKGLWESDLYENPSLPIARISVDKLDQNVTCEVDSFYFEDFSFLNHQNATWQWTFENGIPAVSSLRNPIVHFASAGQHKATLTITDGNGNQSIDSLRVGVNFYSPTAIVSEDFQGSFVPNGWSVYDDNGGGQWSSSSSAGGFGQSSQSAIFNNYDIDSQGSYDDLRFLFSTQSALSSELTFDVAYTPWGTVNSDTLEVLVSLDCGQTFTLLYRKGGTELATAPTNQNAFTPAANEWRTDTVSLAAYMNQAQVMIAFRNWGHWGNNVYLDNVNLLSTFNGIKEESAIPFRVYPNPVQQGTQLTIDFPTTIENEIAKIKIMDISGKEVFSTQFQSNQPFIVSNEQFSGGYYMVNVQTQQKIWNTLLLINK
jgi:photosystem II stability/assembly factor-like uncharacterized protein